MRIISVWLLALTGVLVAVIVSDLRIVLYGHRLASVPDDLLVLGGPFVGGRLVTGAWGLWQLRASGRRHAAMGLAAALFFVAVGPVMLLWRSYAPRWGHLAGLAIAVALPLAVLLSRPARESCNQAPSPL